MRRWLGLCAMTGLFVGTPALAKGKKQSWGNSVYMRPSLGGTSFTPETGDPVSVISMGGVGGIHYWERGRKYPKLRGHARVAGSYVMSGGPLSGFETRLGNFIGPTWGNVGVTVGPDFFYNQYQYGPTTIPATVPGTPTAKCPRRLASLITLPSASRYISRRAAKGAFSRKSSAPFVPSASR